MEDKKEKVARVVGSKKFHWSFSVLGVLFIILTFFIAARPELFTPYGYVGVFLFNIIGSGLLLIPIVSAKFDLLLLILFSALGNMINTSVNYFVGYSGRDRLPQSRLIDTMKHWIERFGLLMVYILSIAPFPIDIAGLLSGYLRIPYRQYVLVNFLGKITIFTLLGLGILSFIRD